MEDEAALSGKYMAYPEYKDSGVEWLSYVPATWLTTRSKFLFDFVTSGSRGWGEHYSDDGSFFFRITNLTRDTIEPKLEDIKCVKPPFGSEGERAKIKKNDLLISITADLGSVCVATEDIVDGYVSQHVSLCRPNSKVVSARWLGYYILSNVAKEQFLGSGYGGTKMQLSLEDVRELWVVKPSEEEQQKIANFLDHETAKIDTLIEKQQQLIALLKEKRQAVISHAVTKGLQPNVPMRDSGVEWLGEVPEHWVVCKIKQVAKLESGHTPDKKIESYWVDCDIPWVSLNDSTQLKQVDYITETAFYLNEKGIENSSARKLPARCVVFTRDASIGLAAITTKVMAVSQHVIAWVCDEEKVNPEYLLLIFYAMKDELDRYTAGATLKTIGLPDVNKLSGGFPDTGEQKKIIKHVFSETKKFDLLIAKSELAVGIIKERRTALISEAVTGKIDVRNWQDPSLIGSVDEVK